MCLFKIHIASEPNTYKGIGFRQIQQISQTFSFWQNIYLNPTQHKQEELESILKHEQIHVKGWHTLDVLLAELNSVFYWFNPGVWFMKKAVKENLEFIADQHVVNAGVDKREYQYLLLKVIGTPEPHIANQFSFPSLRRRIAMMNKIPTKRTNQLRLLIVLPLVTVLLFAFKNATQTNNNLTKVEAARTEIKESTKNSAKVLQEDYKGFLKRNPTVKRVFWVPDEEAGKDAPYIVIELKSEGFESYRLDNKQDIAAAEKKYGKLPSIPVTPPLVDNTELPAPPPPVEIKNGKVVEATPAKVNQQQNGDRIIFPADTDYYQTEKNLPVNYKNFLKRNPTVEKVGWKLKDSKGPEAVIILLKSGETETYQINDAQSMATAESKYGKLPDLLPPPPPVKTEKPGTPPPPPAPAEPGTPPPPPAPADEKLPPPPPPVRHDSPLVPTSGGAHLVEDEQYVTYILWPKEITKREFEVARQAFKESGFDLTFDEKYNQGKLTNLKITVSSSKEGKQSNAVYTTNSLQSLKESDNVVIVKANKKTREIIIGTTIAKR